MEMKTPLFAWEPDDLTAFATLEEMESYLEPEDVEANVYSAYDAEGKLLALSVAPGKSILGFRTRRVVARVADESPAHAAAFRSILVSYARKHLAQLFPSEAEIDELPMSHLVDVVAADCIPKVGWWAKRRR